MKRLNKKGFTLVELLAAIVILAVLMLVGAQAVGGIMRTSRANTLMSSLDMAAKQANLKLVSGELGDSSNKNTLEDVLSYKKTDYDVEAWTSADGDYVYTRVIVNATGGFASVKCSHGKLAKYKAKETGKDYYEVNYKKVGYYCVDGIIEGTPSTLKKSDGTTSQNKRLFLIKVESVADVIE